MKCHFCISIHFLCSKVIGATMAGTTIPVFISYHIFVLLLTGLNKRSKFNYSNGLTTFQTPRLPWHTAQELHTASWQTQKHTSPVHRRPDMPLLIRSLVLPGLWDIPLNIHNLPPRRVVHLANYWVPVTRVINVQDCHQRLSSAFDILLIFLYSLIPTTP